MPQRTVHHDAFDRIAPLRLRLRSGVGVSRQRARGQRWFVLHDALGNRHARLSPAAWAFVGLLDGRRDVRAALTTATANAGDAAPTEGEAVRLLAQLWSADMLAGELPPDAGALFARLERRTKRERIGKAAGFLFVRIPIADPQPIIDRLAPLGRIVYSPAGAVAWFLLIAAGLYALVTSGVPLRSSIANTLTPETLPLVALVFIATKLLHELGHGLACRTLALRDPPATANGRSGRAGEVRELGVMLLVFFPVPYVDASAAWSLRSKWSRAMVGAAGMHAELAVAAIAAIVYASTTPGSTPHAVAFAAVFLAGVSTLLFNANPLLRYDGYYILSDLTDQPNLASRSRDAALATVKRRLLGARRVIDPAHSAGERAGLSIFAIASGAYKLFIAAVIVWFVSDMFFVFGVLLAAGAFAVLVIVPIGKAVHYLMTSDELARSRPRALLAAAALVVLVAVPLATVPVRSATAAPGIVEAASTEQATARTGARIASAKPAWTRVTAGDPVLTLDNPALLAERDAIAARLRAEDLRAFAALARGETAAAASHESERSTLQDALDRVERDIAELTIRAPFDAVWLPAPAAQSEGRWVRPGDALGRFVQLSDRRIVALVPQGSRALRGGAVRKATLITPSGQTLNAALASVSTVGTRVLPSPALALEAGGSVRTTMPESVGTPLALEPFFRAVLTTPEDVAPPVGQRVWVRFEHPPEPILTQAARTVRGLLQRRAGGEQ